MRTLAVGKSARRISLTPLIDVVFILLVFFMLETTFRQEGGVELLGGQPGSASSGQAASIFELFDEQTIWVDGARRPYAEWLATPSTVDPDAKLRSAPNISVQHVLRTLDALRSQGAARVRFGQVQGFGS
ncbi:MAG: biopolymer transporter ExbD [Gammaproteobacteria bacterium]|nr:biopolymer transporter ExbD [Gammaproteobacteria bacterium]MDE0270201.1 biopolymer transporter ExbD [Gammaproteobacteria bacterium]